MKALKKAWARWRLQCALDELQEMQSRSDVGPVYLCGLMAHISELERSL